MGSTNRNRAYRYDESAGEGTTVYVVDTGVFGGHIVFRGRVAHGANTVDSDNRDGNGHGTHVAGIVSQVAKRASIVSVKVLGATGMGTTQSVIAGLDWLKTHAQSTGVVSKAVVNLSLGFPLSRAMNLAAEALVDAGLTLVAGVRGFPAPTDSVRMLTS